MNEYLITTLDGQEITVEADEYSDADKMARELGLEVVSIDLLRKIYE